MCRLKTIFTTVVVCFLFLSALAQKKEKSKWEKIFDSKISVFCKQNKQTLKKKVYICNSPEILAIKKQFGPDAIAYMQYYFPKISVNIVIFEKAAQAERFGKMTARKFRGTRNIFLTDKNYFFEIMFTTLPEAVDLWAVLTEDPIIKLIDKLQTKGVDFVMIKKIPRSFYSKVGNHLGFTVKNLYNCYVKENDKAAQINFIEIDKSKKNEKTIAEYLKASPNKYAAEGNVLVEIVRRDFTVEDARKVMAKIKK